MEISKEKLSLKKFKKYLKENGYQHKEMASGRWFDFSLSEQMANIGADVGRAINWKNKGNQQYSQNAFFRALELLSLTIDDPKNKDQLKELTRLYEVLGDYFAGDNEYGSSDENMENYFYFYNCMAQAERHKTKMGIDT